MLKRIKNSLKPRRARASVLVLTLALMLVFSGQVLMMGLVTTKSLTESGALYSIGMNAREEALSAMHAFEVQEVYPAYLGWVETSRSTPGTQHITGANYLADYAQAASARQDGSGVNWSNYRIQIWDEGSNAYVNGDFSVDVWMEATDLGGGVYEWPYQIVAHVTGKGIDQTIRRDSTLLPQGFTDS